mgnify:CR=1 FL=1
MAFSRSKLARASSGRKPLTRDKADDGGSFDVFLVADAVFGEAVVAVGVVLDISKALGAPGKLAG